MSIEEELDKKITKAIREQLDKMSPEELRKLKETLDKMKPGLDKLQVELEEPTNPPPTLADPLHTLRDKWIKLISYSTGGKRRPGRYPGPEGSRTTEPGCLLQAC